MKQKKYTDKYGNVYYKVTFQAKEALFFSHEDPEATLTATVEEGCISGYSQVTEVEGKKAFSACYCTPKIAVKHCWIGI